MIDGFWLVRAEGPQGNGGGGVATFINGKIFGGDSGFYYTEFIKKALSLRHESGFTSSIQQFRASCPSARVTSCPLQSL
jgi:hypothetical protein